MLVLRIGETLGRSESEVLDLPSDEIARWGAYFKIQQEASAQATKRARTRRGGRVQP